MKTSIKGVLAAVALSFSGWALAETEFPLPPGFKSEYKEGRSQGASATVS
ncbi:hypothetical protein GIW56_10440 [Pseudomonas gessardii]|uniref:Uncharacterized protein n=1 Tax=Pseudomonas gessardii TaxID=78544 RepID=A0ABS9F4G6_9PSED|nr:hypothetical protein [Pseudomonas gessardii]MCF4979619.1 hypothetical protein [Pseudomonas gessardii]MCF5084505.1 hypothetical protein [Pseudomonas gessardii]MCF5095162.1 hypothetical protein [Pseudomonas gessardii]MCF5107260.1 hypothetical protein [Pseudomonas gessardii]